MVSNKPSIAKNASGNATLRTTLQETSPSFHWFPANSLVINAYPRKRITNPLILSQERAFILCGMADEPTCPFAKPSVANSAPAIKRNVVAIFPGAAAI